MLSIWFVRWWAAMDTVPMVDIMAVSIMAPILNEHLSMAVGMPIMTIFFIFAAVSL